MTDSIERAKTHFLKAMEDGIPRYDSFPHHVKHVERWAKRIFEIYPSADEEIVLLSVWLHDIGHADGDTGKDHAIKSESEARRFLASIELAPERIEAVAHCVRAHRCRDVPPQTTEAKILAVADSASHMTDLTYLEMLQDGVPKMPILEKLERDYRDIEGIPEMKDELAPLYRAWKKLLDTFPDMG
jgi:predicted metal-dependent HD superfamily phosphohydrolase